MSSCDTEVELSQNGYDFIDYVIGWRKHLSNEDRILVDVKPDNRFHMRFFTGSSEVIVDVYTETIQAGEILLLEKARDHYYKKYQEINSLLNKRNII